MSGRIGWILVGAALLVGVTRNADVGVTLGPASPAQTGQTLCYDAKGVVIPCAGTGQDGEHRRGVPWPARRFTDNNDGTVTDHLTDLVWLKVTRCKGAMTWLKALEFARDMRSGECGLTDSSYPGEWRLPSIFELRSLLDMSRISPPLSDSMGTGPWKDDDPFTGRPRGVFWSSTTYVASPDQAWGVEFDGAGIDAAPKKSSIASVWLVR